MFPFVIKMHSIFVLTFFTLSFVTGKSSIQPVLNPGCKGCLSNQTILVYVKAQESENCDYVIHQVWDFTGHIPTMLYVLGNENSTLDVEWDGIKPTQILTNGSFYSFAIILNNLFEYNDVNDKVYFDYSDPYREISLRDVAWRLEENILNDYKAKVRVRGALSWEHHRMNGTLDVKLLLVPFESRSLSMPRLFHSVNSTLVDVSLVGLSTSPRYKSPRFALQYIIVSEDCDTDVLQNIVHRSVDDEYTPGVFETINLMTPASKGRHSGFVQYRPVAYTSRVRDVGSSVTAYVQTQNHNRTTIPHDCLAERYYATIDKQPLLVNEIVASFGQSGDGFYNQTNYTVWTYTVGYGVPPTESVSVFLVVMLVLGVATPVTAVVCSFLISRRMLRRERQARLEEDEA